jgi:hypothetical protein
VEAAPAAPPRAQAPAPPAAQAFAPPATPSRAAAAAAPPVAQAPAPAAPRPTAAAPAPAPAADVWPSVARPAGAGAPAAPVATLEAELECGPEAERCWCATVAGINARKRMLGAFLEETRFVGLAADALVVAMDHVHTIVVEERENLAIMTEEAARAFGRALALRCVPLDESQRRRRPTLEDVAPLVEQAIEFFQGEPVEPKPRRGERTEG